MSVTRLTHNICVANNGIAQFNNVAINIVITSPRLHDNRKIIDFLILLYIFLPSSIALTPL